MLKMLRVPASLGSCLVSLSIATSVVSTAPCLVAANRHFLAKATSTQCRSLFAAVVSSKHMGPDFYSRKVDNLRTLPIADSKLRALQTRFSSVFSNMETAHNRNDVAASDRLGQQASQLVGELNRYCFQ